MQADTKEVYVDFRLALLLIVGVITVVFSTGLFVGNKYFWNQYDDTPRLERELQQQIKLISKDPNNPDALLQLGWIYFQQGNKGEALKYYQKLLRINPNHIGALFNSGLVYLDQGKYQLAEKKFTSIRKKHPKHLENLMALSEVYIAMKRPDEAIEVLENLIKLKRSWTQAHYLLGQALFMKGETDKAEQSYKEALRYDPKFAPAAEGLATLEGDLHGK